MLLLPPSHHTNHIAVQCVDLILSATKVEVKCTNNKNILSFGVPNRKFTICSSKNKLAKLKVDAILGGNLLELSILCVPIPSKAFLCSIFLGLDLFKASNC